MPTLEETILGHLMLQPELLDKLEIDKSLFTTQKQRFVFKEIKAGNTDPVLIAEKMRARDSYSYVSSLLDGIPRTKVENLQRYINRIKAEQIKRKVSQEIIEVLKFPDADFSEIRKSLEQLDSLKGEYVHDIETWGTFKKKNIPERKVIVQFHAEKEAVTNLSGPHKRGKSLYVTQLALCVASGNDFLDFIVPKPRKVLLYQQEISAAAMKQRLELMTDTGNFPMIEENFLIKNTVGNLMKITNPAHRRQMDREIDEYKPELIIFDPYITFHEKKENDSKEMSEVLDHFFAIATKFKVGVIIVHHFGKPSLAPRTGGHRLRGHSVLGDRPDMLVLFNSLPDKYKNSPLPYPYDHYAELEFILRSDAAPDNHIIERDPETLLYRLYDLYGQLGRKILPEMVRNIIREEGGEMRRKELLSILLEKASIMPAKTAIEEAQLKGYIKSEKILGERGNPILYRVIKEQ